MEQKFILGKAKTAIASGFEKTTETPFISFTEIKKSPFKVGEDMLNSNKEFEEGYTTVLIVKNLEGLAVLERAIKLTKQKLISEKKLL